MDFSLVAYTASAFAALMTFSTVTYFGTWELQTQSVPPYLAKQGYTPAIFVNQVNDAVVGIRREMVAQSQTEIVTSGKVSPAGELASFFGIASLIRATQHSFGLTPPKIEIEVIERGQEAHWRLRGPHAVRGWTVERGQVPIEDAELLIRQVAYGTLGYVSPFEALSYDLIQDSWAGDYAKSIARATSLLSECEKQALVRTEISWGTRAAAFVPEVWWGGTGCTATNVRFGLVLRGLAHLDSGAYGPAFDDLGTANTIGESDALATAFLGDAVFSLGDEAAAATIYGRARGLDGKIAKRFQAFGQGFAKAGRHVQAIRRFATAASLGAEGAGFLADWGDSLFATGAFEAALAKYEQAEALDPETRTLSERIDKAQKALADLSAREKGANQPVPPGAAVQPVPEGAARKTN